MAAPVAHPSRHLTAPCATSATRGGAVSPGISADKATGKNPGTIARGAVMPVGGRPFDAQAYYRVFRDRWPDFIRANFRTSAHVAVFFNVDDRTARQWMEGTTAPRGQCVALAVVAMPDEARAFLQAE